MEFDGIYVQNTSPSTKQNSIVFLYSHEQLPVTHSSPEDSSIKCFCVVEDVFLVLLTASKLPRGSYSVKGVAELVTSFTND